MPELPDITVYIEALETRIVGQTLERVQVGSPFVVRTFEPSLTEALGQRVSGLRRLGKRIAIGLENELWLVLHLMIAGRLHWKPGEPGISPRPRRRTPIARYARASKLGKQTLAQFEFTSGTLSLTEAGTQRRASLHVVRGEEGLAGLDPGGLEVLTADLPAFAARLTRRNHTLKRALTDPYLFSGIGNAYSDEILHRARLSPVALTQKLEPEQIERLFRAVQDTMREWTDRLREEAGEAFPEGVTAFRELMAVHGRYGAPCPECGAPVQRIRYAENETNYCARCQTGGKVLADRSLSRLLKGDWPRRIEELEG